MGEIRTVATVFGGNSFIGRYVVEQLARQGYVVRVSVADPANANALRVCGRVGQIVPLYNSFQKMETVVRAIEGAKIVINLLEERHSKNKSVLELMNIEGAGKIAQFCAAAGVEKLIHISALGADEQSHSPYLRSKKASEVEVYKFFPSAIILRPSIPFGPEDYFLNTLARIIRYFPVMPVYCSKIRLQPIYVGDVASAIMKVITLSATNGSIYELAGAQIFTNYELIEWLTQWLHRKNRLCPLPRQIVKLAAFFTQYLPGQLISSKLLDQLEYDSILSDSNNNGLEMLGITPESITMSASTFLYSYRPAVDFKRV